MNIITKKNSAEWAKLYADLENQIAQHKYEPDLQAINEKAEEYKKKIEHAKAMLAEQSAYPKAYTYGGIPTVSQWVDVMNRPGPSLVQRHRRAFSQPVSCPHCNYNTDLNGCIQHLNDQAGWTREAIADWLDTLDEQPIFYPDTCSENCDCKLCKPEIPEPGWSLPKPAYLSPGETVISTNKINDYAITNSIIAANTVSIADYLPTLKADVSAITYQFHKLADEISTMWHSYVGINVVNKSDYQIQGSLAQPNNYNLVTYNDSWNVDFTLPDQVLHQLPSEQFKAIQNLLMQGGAGYQLVYNQDKIEYMLTFEGSHKYILGVMNNMKEYLNVPEHACNCAGSNYQPGKHCPKHSASKSAKHK